MGDLSEAVRAEELVLSVSPHVVPLHTRTPSGRLPYGAPPLQGAALEIAEGGGEAPGSRLGRLAAEEAPARSHLRSASAMPASLLVKERRANGAASLGRAPAA